MKFIELAMVLCISLHGSIDVDANNKQNQTKEVGLLIGSLGHAALLFLNNQLVGESYMAVQLRKLQLAISCLICEVDIIS